MGTLHMKRLGLTILTVLISSSSALAQQATATGVGVGVSSSTSKSDATAISGQGGKGGKGGQGGTATSSLVVNGAATPAATVSTINENTTLKNVPTAFAPGLTAAGLETCLGSVSGGGSALGWGATFGTTIPDQGCAARLDARTLWSFGLKKAAVARLCLMPDVYRSMPEVCNKYLPQNYIYAAAVTTTESMASAEPASAEQASEIEYTGGPVQVRERKTGAWRMCNDYDVTQHRCRVWAHE